MDQCPRREETSDLVQLEQVSFHDGIALERVPGSDVFRCLDFLAYFDMRQVPFPDGHKAILEAMQRDRLIEPCEAGSFNITNLGAILFAKKLDYFRQLKRKTVRVVHYRGKGRIEAIKEREWHPGYASGFDGLIDYIIATLPTREVIGRALRRTEPVFPRVAIREVVANALIHQDFFVTGAGPMVEIFDDRVEVTNPGEPLVDTRRFLDTPPKSRNETLASLMRRVHICEERGSGIDKAVSDIEFHQLPAPLFEVPPGFTRVVVFCSKPLADMDRLERIRACYLHACLKHVMRERLTHASLRKRFGIEDNDRAVAFRYIREAVEEGSIKPFDKRASKKFMQYVPFWT